MVVFTDLLEWYTFMWWWIGQTTVSTRPYVSLAVERATTAGLIGAVIRLSILQKSLLVLDQVFFWDFSVLQLVMCRSSSQETVAGVPSH